MMGWYYRHRRHLIKKKELSNNPYPYNINGKLYYKTTEEANANDENNQHTTITFNENTPSNFKLYTPIIFNGTRPSNYVSADPIPPDATSTNLFIQDYTNLNKGWSKLSYPTKEYITTIVMMDGLGQVFLR